MEGMYLLLKHLDLPLNFHVLLFNGYNGLLYPGLQFFRDVMLTTFSIDFRDYERVALSHHALLCLHIRLCTVEWTERDVEAIGRRNMSLLSWAAGQSCNSLSGQPFSGRELKAELRGYKSEWQPVLSKLRTELFGSKWGLIEVRSKSIYTSIYLFVGFG